MEIKAEIEVVDTASQLELYKEYCSEELEKSTTELETFTEFRSRMNE